MKAIFKSSVLAAALALLATVSCCLSGCGAEREEKAGSGTDRDGRFVLVEAYGVNDLGSMSRMTYQYDDAGMMLSSKSEGEYPNGVEYDVDRNEYTYSEDGKSGQINSYVNDELVYTVDLKLDKNKQVSETTWYDPDGKAYAYQTYDYDKNGYCIESKTIRLPSEEREQEYECVYDDNGNKQKEVQRFQDGSEKRWVYTYDEDGFLMQIDFWNQDSDTTMHEYALCGYDEDEGVLTEEWYDENGDFLSRHELEYDKHGNIVKESVYYQDGTLASTTTMKYLWIKGSGRDMWGG